MHGQMTREYRKVMPIVNSQSLIELSISLCYKNSFSREMRCQYGVPSSKAKTKGARRKNALCTNQMKFPSSWTLIGFKPN